jgi:hypothetical protein
VVQAYSPERLLHRFLDMGPYMSSNVRNAGACLCTALLVAGAPATRAQENPADQQDHTNRLRGSRLVGSGDSLAIETASGDLIPYGRRGGCLQPVSQNGVIKVDCTPSDGPADYFEESTRALIASCSFWFPDAERCPPKQWPIEVQGCDGTVPERITGTWRFDAIPTAGGFSRVGDGWDVTLNDASMTFDFRRAGQITRSYTVVESGQGRFTLEIRGGNSDTTAIDIELAPCGIFIEADGVCDVFCENIAGELGTPTEAQLRANLGDRFDEATLERILEIAKSEQEPQPLFLERAYFRAVTSD